MSPHVDAETSGLLESLSALPGALHEGLRAFLDEYLGATVPFGGRHAEFEALDRWLADPQASRALVIAEAGRGKSALLSRWAANVSARGSARVAFVPVSIRFHTALASAFAGILRVRVSALCDKPLALEALSVADEIAEIHALLRQDQPDDAPPVVVVLDGLDEAVGWMMGRTFGLPESLGRKVKILVSARILSDCDENGWAERLGFQAATRVPVPKLPATAVREVLENMGEPLSLLEGRVDLVAQLHRLSEGDPLLIRLFVEALRAEGENAAMLTPEDLANVRPGLEGFFAQWWDEQRRQWGTATPLEEPHVRTVLDLLSSALGPLSAADLDVLTGSKRAAIPRALGRFVIGNGTSRGFVFSHPRFGQFLRERMTSEQQLQNDERFVHYGLDVVARLSRSELAPADVPAYVLQHHVAHLDRVGAPDSHYDDLMQRGWMEAWEVLDGGFGGFFRDLDRAFALADRAFSQATTVEARGKAMVRQLRCQEIRERITQIDMVIGQELPALLLEEGLWTPAIALERAKLLRGEDRAAMIRLTLPYLPDERLWEVSALIRDAVRLDGAAVYELLRVDLAQRFVKAERFAEAAAILESLEVFPKTGVAVYELMRQLPDEHASTIRGTIFANLYDNPPDEAWMPLEMRVEIVASIAKTGYTVPATWLAGELRSHRPAWIDFSQRVEAFPESDRKAIFQGFVEGAEETIKQWDDSPWDGFVYSLTWLLSVLPDDAVRRLLVAFEARLGAHPLATPDVINAIMYYADWLDSDIPIRFIRACVRAYSLERLVDVVLLQPAIYALIALASEVPDPYRETLLSRALEIWPSVEMYSREWNQQRAALTRIDPKWELRFIESAPPIRDSFSSVGDMLGVPAMVQARMECARRFGLEERRAVLQQAWELLEAHCAKQYYPQEYPFWALTEMFGVIETMPGIISMEQWRQLFLATLAVDHSQDSRGHWTRDLVDLARIVPYEFLDRIEEEALRALDICSRAAANERNLEPYDYGYQRQCGSGAAAPPLVLLSVVEQRLSKDRRDELRKKLYARALEGQCEIWRSATDEQSLWRRLFNAEERKEMLRVSTAKARRFAKEHWSLRPLTQIADAVSEEMRPSVTEALVPIASRAPLYQLFQRIEDVAKVLSEEQRLRLADIVDARLAGADESTSYFGEAILLHVAPYERKRIYLLRKLAEKTWGDWITIDPMLSGLTEQDRFIAVHEKIDALEKEGGPVSVAVRLRGVLESERGSLIEQAFEEAKDKPYAVMEHEKFFREGDFLRICELMVPFRAQHPEEYREHHSGALFYMGDHLSPEAFRKYTETLILPSLVAGELNLHMLRRWVKRAVRLGEFDLAKKLASYIPESSDDFIVAQLIVPDSAPAGEYQVLQEQADRDLWVHVEQMSSPHYGVCSLAWHFAEKPFAASLARRFARGPYSYHLRLRAWDTLWSELDADTQAELTPALVQAVEEAVEKNHATIIFREALDVVPLELLARVWLSGVGAAGKRTSNDEEPHSFFTKYAVDCAAIGKLGGDPALVEFSRIVPEVNAWFR